MNNNREDIRLLHTNPKELIVKYQYLVNNIITKFILTGLNVAGY